MTNFDQSLTRTLLSDRREFGSILKRKKKKKKIKTTICRLQSKLEQAKYHEIMGKWLKPGPTIVKLMQTGNHWKDHRKKIINKIKNKNFDFICFGRGNSKRPTHTHKK